MKTKSTQQSFTPIVPGVIHVTGEHDVGKTLFALQCGAHPARMAFIDDDIKGRGTVDQLKSAKLEFGFYCDLRKETRGMPQLKVYEKCMAVVEKLEEHGDLDVIVWDTWSRFTSTLKPYVRKNMSKFREAADWASQGAIKGPQQWKEAQGYEAQIMSRLTTVAPLVILITHLKDKYIGSRRTDKQIPDATRTMARVPIFRVWLRRNPKSPVPIALILKRPNLTAFEEGIGLRTVNMLPLRVEPQPGERSVWDAIRRYANDPIGDRVLEKHEIPSAFEKSLIDGTLTEDQRRAWMLALAADAGEVAEAQSDAEVDVVTQVTEMRSDGDGDAAIAKALKGLGKSFPEIAKGMGVSVGQVAKWCKGK